MAAQFCNRELEYLTHLVINYKTLVSTICVLHFILSPVAILGNLLIIRSLLKASSIPANVKKLLLSLAFSDFFVGMFVQLMYCSFIVKVLRMAASGNHNFTLLCPTILTVCHFLMNLLVCASFFSITMVAVDRLFAVSLHLRYQELVTSKRLVTALVSVWVISGVFASMSVSGAHTSVEVTAVILQCVGFFLSTVANIRIYKVVRYHQDHIQSQFQQANGQAKEIHREKKSALNAVFVYVVFIACYLPWLCTQLMLQETARSSSSTTSITIATKSATGFVVVLNSSLNPIVYCWRFREIRQLAKSMVKNIFRINET